MTGKEYATSTNSDIYLYEVQGRTTKNISSFNPGYDMNPVFRPMGNISYGTA